MVEYFAKWRSELDQPAKVAASEGYEGYGVPHGGGSVVRRPRIWMSSGECRLGCLGVDYGAIISLSEIRV